MQNKVALALAFLAAASCASGGGKGPRGDGARPTSAVSQPERLLAHARKVQAEKGCAAAIPAYRVVAAFGAGYDVAQFELGACLLRADNTGDARAALLKQEASFWLTRAAWAGNARAQLTLASALSGAPAAGALVLETAPHDALKWALVYDQNSARNLYSMKPVSRPVLEHLNATLSPALKTAAHSFAERFTPVQMAAFAAPRMENRSSGSEQRQQSGGKGRGRRR